MSYNYQSASEVLILHGLFRCVIRFSTDLLSQGHKLWCRIHVEGFLLKVTAATSDDGPPVSVKTSCTQRQWLHRGQQTGVKGALRKTIKDF